MSQNGRAVASETPLATPAFLSGANYHTKGTLIMNDEGVTFSKSRPGIMDTCAHYLFAYGPLFFTSAGALTAMQAVRIYPESIGLPELSLRAGAATVLAAAAYLLWHSRDDNDPIAGETAMPATTRFNVLGSSKSAYAALLLVLKHEAHRRSDFAPALTLEAGPSSEDDIFLLDYRWHTDTQTGFSVAVRRTSKPE